MPERLLGQSPRAATQLDPTARGWRLRERAVLALTIALGIVAGTAGAFVVVMAIALLVVLALPVLLIRAGQALWRRVMR